MRLELEHSAGGVVYRIHQNRPEILLIFDRFGRWSFPKGLIEKNETLEQAALREIQEETGVVGRIIVDLPPTHYHYKNSNGELVSKTVNYYLVEAIDDESLEPQETEISDVKWVPLDDAFKTKGYSNNRQVLKEAISLIAETADGKGKR